MVKEKINLTFSKQIKQEYNEEPNFEFSPINYNIKTAVANHCRELFFLQK